ncbi:glycoside hydrolase family 25 protein [Parabacteroides sp. OttesenSCG-928-B22]|nr:glycoside hydrolase family 25 protein [Parabacteroides sp. OttesenSCG-928-B22]
MTKRRKTALFLFLFLCIGAIALTYCGKTGDHGYQGIDVSHHQGEITWEQVGADKNIQFVYIKATEGTSFKDPKYRYNTKQAQKQGIKTGAYHYFRTTSNPQRQAEHFIKTIKSANHELIPVVDVEECEHRNRKKLQDSLKIFCNTIEQQCGIKPVIYSTNQFYLYFLYPQFNEYKLWIANYYLPFIILPNKKYTIWQFSEKGKLKGIETPVDLDRLHPKFTVDDLLLK